GAAEARPLGDLLDRGWGDARVGQGIPRFRLLRTPREEMLDLLRGVRVGDERRSQSREESIAPGVIQVRMRVHHITDMEIARSRPDGVRERLRSPLAESRIDDQDAIPQLDPP